MTIYIFTNINDSNYRQQLFCNNVEKMFCNNVEKNVCFLKTKPNRTEKKKKCKTFKAI